MRPSPPAMKLFWFVGGEIMAAGGPLALDMRGAAPSPGCRPVPIPEARRLAQAFPRLTIEATRAGDAQAADYYERAGADLSAALSRALAMRAA